MAKTWQIVGGAAKGGLIVRDDEDFMSAQLPKRLSTGSLVEELETRGDRLHFRRLTGAGPEEGWISVKLKDKVLAAPTEQVLPELLAMAAEAMAEDATLELANQVLTRLIPLAGSFCPQVLLARGLMYWRWNKLDLALKDFEEARRAHTVGAAEVLLALQVCLGCWPAAKKLASELQLKQVSGVIDGWMQGFNYNFSGGAAEFAAEELEIFSDYRQIDGRIAAIDDIELGVRLFLRVENGEPQISRPLVLYFHGNGETVDTYKDAKVFEPLRAAGANCLVVDFRGYGYSKGGGGTSLQMLHVDADFVCDALPTFLEERGLPWPWPGRLVLFGRSLGGRIACHLAALRGQIFTGGVVLESAACGSYAPGAKPPPERPVDKGNPMNNSRSVFSSPEFLQAVESTSKLCQDLVAQVPGVITSSTHFVHMLGNEDKLRSYGGRLLILHGDLDTLIPASHAQRNLQAADAATRRLVLLGKGHNDISFDEKYIQALDKFLQGL